MDISDSRRIKQIRDNTGKMADAFSRIADALERLTEQNCSENPNNCDTCANGEGDIEACGYCRHGDLYEPKDEPQKCYLRKSCDHYGDKQVCGRCREYNLYSHTKTEPQTKMSLDDAYYLVYKDLTRMDGILTGKYDAKNGNQQYMNGVWSVMELIAYGVGIDCYHAFNERYSKNMVESMERAEGSK